MTKKFAALRPKTYSYLTNGNDENRWRGQKIRWTKNVCHKKETEHYKNC